MKLQNHHTGLVSDIQRFSLHDGPGIRTTVFLKGCPLNCKWCHNPETQISKPQLSFSTDKCMNCFKCVEVCPTGTHYIIDEQHKVNFSSCKLNGECVTVCPNDSLRIVGKESSVNETLELVLRDKDYYKNSSGGLTISGGEPMNQFSFTRDLLQLAKLNGIHTVLETCGFAPKNRYLDILHLVDLFLYDYKETDPVKHKEFTGVDSKVIIDNLRALHDNGANIILRCPIIPSVNDRDDHFEGIAELVSQLPNLKSVELLAYHDIGRDKAEKVGRDNEYYHIENATEKMKKEWLQKLNELNVINVSIG
ncbi:MAG: glycyl-radical enzyme activating protein [Ignavibacteriales bacterium]|jgi:pyruvate formate lyase activating enzyme|nr:MAG: glycyl-radical enzyme activating protein [Ignavibacteriales bacterium]